MPIGHHLVFRYDDAAVLAPDAATRRALARIVLHAGQHRGLLGFGLADNHLHVVTLGAVRPSRLASECSRRIARLRPGARFEPARIRPIDGQAHLAHSIGYVQRQDRHHGVDQDPHREGTSLPDLLGLRIVAPWLVARVRRALPRLRGRDLLAELGVEGLDERFTPDHLVGATCAALALPHLDGNTPPAVLGRGAAVLVARAHLSEAEIATLLSLSRRAVRRVQRVDADPTLVRAIHLQMDLHARVPTFDATRVFTAPTSPR